MGRGGLTRCAALTALLLTAPAVATAQPSATTYTQRATDLSAPPPMPPSPPLLIARSTPTQVARPPARSPGLLPTLRLAFGSDIGPANGRVDAGFAFDVALGLAYISNMNHTGVWLWPELGYASDGRASGGGSFFTAGGSLLIGSGMLAAGVSSRFLAGDTRDLLGLGVRTSLLVQFGYTFLTLEAGHQWVTTDANDRHEFRVTLAINPLLIVAGIAMLAAPGEMLRGGFNLFMGR